MTDVSIIIVNYNTTQLTKDCIRSIHEWTRKQSYEIIVVDNASPDKSIAALKAEFPEVKLLLSKENLGFGKANNLGIREATGQYIFLLNSDTYLIHDAIAVLHAYMEKPGHRKVGVCGAELFYPDGAPQMSFGNFPSIREAISNLGFFVLYKDYFEKHIRAGVFNYSPENKEVDYITGADMFIRGSVLKEAGAFDPDFFMYFEETELTYRIKKAGYQVVLVPGARIIHLEGASQDKAAYFNYSKIKMLAESRQLYFKKSRGKVVALLIKVIYMLRSLLMFCLKRKKGYLETLKIIYKS